MPIILVFVSLREEVQELEASLGSVARPCFKI
jgi:hypothetical protein